MWHIYRWRPPLLDPLIFSSRCSRVSTNYKAWWGRFWKPWDCVASLGSLTALKTPLPSHQHPFLLPNIWQLPLLGRWTYSSAFYFRSFKIWPNPSFSPVRVSAPVQLICIVHHRAFLTWTFAYSAPCAGNTPHPQPPSKSSLTGASWGLPSHLSQCWTCSLSGSHPIASTTSLRPSGTGLCAGFLCTHPPSQ